MERHSDPDGCFSCHALPGLEYIDKQGVRRVATILQSDYYGSLHGSVPCKDCHRKIERYPHTPEEGYVDCSESCHLEEPSKERPFTHQEVVKEFKTSAHGSGKVPGATKDFHGGNRLTEEQHEQNPSCRRCHSNTPYIEPALLPQFQQDFHHAETECGTCHQGQVWRNQFFGHIFRRLIGKSKAATNTLCADCHDDSIAMQKVTLKEVETDKEVPPSFRWTHAGESYATTLHSRLIAAGNEKGADCLDCHAPSGFRHAVQRSETSTSSTHLAHLASTCSQSSCHGYAKNILNQGFVKTDMHDVSTLRLTSLASWLDKKGLYSIYRRLSWMLVPLSALFVLGSMSWTLWGYHRNKRVPIVGGKHFDRVVLGIEPSGSEVHFTQNKPFFHTMPSTTTAPLSVMTLLYASQTGNGQGIAEEFSSWKGDYRMRVLDMAHYDPADLIRERLLFIICSTHGDGEPPSSAERLYSWLRSGNTPCLEHLSYGVFALGDSRYPQFCKAGKDFDTFLQHRGGRRVIARVDADVDFEELARSWSEAVWERCCAMFGGERPVLSSLKQKITDGYSKTRPYLALIKVNRNINKTGSMKETRHIEIDISGSDLTYVPGDALGVYPKNNPSYVEELLTVLKIDGYDEISLGEERLSVREALYSRLDITTLSQSLMEQYATWCQNDALKELLKKEECIKQYIWGRHIIDLLLEFPAYNTELSLFIGMLRRMPPRLYSIASSMKAVGQSVHLTVGVVRYESHGRNREGVCSTFMGSRLSENDALPVFIQANTHFRLPSDPNIPIIMVGPGTGIAPFRAFLQERRACATKGKQWLFFGDQHRSTDFLYSEEWEIALQKGILTRLNVAFSRDQTEKIYVQTLMRQYGKEVYAWLEEGASFYVCGDASRMAHDVHETLVHIVAEHGGKKREQAIEYVRGLMHTKRYQRDVY